MSIQKNRKIGRGLSSLLGDLTLSDFENVSSKDSENIVQNIEISKILPNPLQPRKNFNIEEIEELAQSIKENGVLQPIIVQNNEDGTYCIIAGERRFRASKIAELATIPCIIKNTDQNQSFIIAMIENIQRSNLNPIEESLGYKTLLEKFNLSHNDIAKIVGKSRSHISNMIGLLSIPSEVKEMISSGEISTGHAKVLKKIENHKELTAIAQKIKNEKLSVRDLEKTLHEALQEEQKSLQKNENTIKIIDFGTIDTQEQQDNAYLSHSVPKDILDMEDAFNANFQQMIHIQHDNIENSGKIVIHYTNVNELREVMSKLIDLSDVYAK